jgi:hypothetical protein
MLKNFVDQKKIITFTLIIRQLINKLLHEN